ncbi:MAG: SufE family protein [Phycisphaeraceae bacterium]
MTASLNDIIEAFQSVDAETRLELLLDYAGRLPQLPEKYRTQAAHDLARVQECMTPVFLWLEKDGDRLRIFAEVAEEAPTVRGFVSILIAAFDNHPCDEVNQSPTDLVKQLGLDGQIRMNRAVGLTAIHSRVRRAAA